MLARRPGQLDVRYDPRIVQGAIKACQRMEPTVSALAGAAVAVVTFVRGVRTLR